MENTNAQIVTSDREISRVAVKLFFGITDDWGLTDDQRCILAGLDTRTTLHNWRQKPSAKKPIKLSKDTLEAPVLSRRYLQGSPAIVLRSRAVEKLGAKAQPGFWRRIGAGPYAGRSCCRPG